METLGQFADAEPYFSSVAQISGALLGLVFVALTFNPKSLGLRNNAAMRALAQQVFADFLLVMIVALTLLIPHTLTHEVGAVVAVVALVGLIRLARSAFVLANAERGVRFQLIQRFWLSLLGNVGFLAAGILLYLGTQDSAAWSALVSSPLLLLIGGARSAWLLVMHGAE